ncbi:MAG: SprB repeat-containing protein, partial [Bacteroidia bacterium]|nr:SprB repeat-containing protein [Bacteroidia bacterium]
MKKFLFQCLTTTLLGGLLTGNSFSQTIMTVGDSIVITGSATITVKGGIVANPGGGIINNGTIYMRENSDAGTESWTNNSSANFLKGTGTTVFNSTDQQTIDGSFSTTFYNLTVNNSSAAGVDIGINTLVSNNLTLTDGLINTSSNYLIVVNSSPLAVSGYSQGATTPSFINGNLRRYINSGTNTYGFPIGNSSNYYLSEIVSSGITGINYLNSRFSPLTNSNDADLTVTESGNVYTSICTDGVWYITPDQNPTSANYDIRCYKGNFTCGLTDNEFAILKRPDNSLTAADWTCGTCGIGVGLSPNGGEGRMASDMYALRKSLTAFSQFGIGKIHICSMTASISSQTDVSCNGGSDGNVAVTQTGGSPAYVYSWNDGQTTNPAINLPAGIYTVTVTDSYECTATTTANISAPPVLTVSVTGTDAICNGTATGSVTASPSGGTLPYAYSWNNGCTDATCNVAAGTYNV